ncbi:MAG: hypothetical protein COY38_05560 [Candidatus Aenigmarchaeota archaeon CG_4_10_14_0_8_um_filter_37_24]|nr:hypothetical protein [Candidatus Aenigmarchaeota archaeon]OIN85418.1 MAG: hypothetical protein AUJ50_05015 [Candidatus Aenigmarchaeota archaeon CG1_02_38_14]PIV68125.1 MAG: hypothetical protein COS07_05200 [Candidatus Aenigmarchaeota archaeon CG01_land_8_20_14_3_00_37_9]PIW40955.1 MAG: hypothetical protein COW21_04490 [Candidatus Aenigmarchaeota archaeon CG15_BIG_FIL_POST_REV_8_21_14_020_37_27]PIX50325.1 MAG: hypothetical protein COZ52_04865 [Candidatus Aenigmarchaeota archaeon CG_4_8_14_3_u
MPNSLPIRIENWTWYEREARRWVNTISQYTSTSSSQHTFQQALDVFYSIFAEDGNLLVQGLRFGFQGVLDRQIDLTCNYLGITRIELENAYFL